MRCVVIDRQESEIGRVPPFFLPSGVLGCQRGFLSIAFSRKVRYTICAGFDSIQRPPRYRLIPGIFNTNFLVQSYKSICETNKRIATERYVPLRSVTKR